MVNLLNKAFIIFGIGLLFLNLYIYNYMFFCRWKFNQDVETTNIIMLGDPQMEGDFRIRREGLKGKYNIFFNDNYFKHIVSNIEYYLNPSIVVVLGDLFSSQYINDEEFSKRTDRYRNIFSPLKDHTKLINVTGNHDVGYANEVNEARINRFEASFGKINDKFFVGGHLIGVVNSINLDSSYDEKLQSDVWTHLKELKHDAESTQSPLIIVTHIPLYKDIHSIDRTLPIYRQYPWLCREEYQVKHTANNHVKEQTMLTKETTDYILNEIKPLFVFNGHDHDGCIYQFPSNPSGFNTTEYTIRSMMGGYGGYSALFEFRKINNNNNANVNNNYNNNNNDKKEFFEYQFQLCPFLDTKYINITFGVNVGWAILFLLFNIIYSLYNRYLIKKQQALKKKK
ncbi:hypothetical protein ACTFIU_000216 [Dictyostelium citrinum]